MTAKSESLTAVTIGMRWFPACPLALLALAGGCTEAPSTPEHDSSNIVAESQGREAPTASIASFQVTASLGKFIGHTARGALWSDRARLGIFEFDSGANRLVVTLPRDEDVACAAWSEDGSLLAAVSRVGSAVLWSADGTLLSDVPGDSQVDACSESDFTFATATRRVFVTAGNEPARLLGERFGVTLASDSSEFPYRTFSSDGRRLFVATQGEHVRVYDTIGALQLRELPGFFELLPVSANGRYLALQNGDDQVDLYDYDSLTRVQTVLGSKPAFHLDLLVVDSPGEDERTSGAVAYGLRPFERRWERHEVEIYQERGFNPTPWRVGGIAGVGYSVVDLATGESLATWRASGYACAYQWAWESGTLAFLEGDRLTFWSKDPGTRTLSSQCEGALKPIFSADRTRFLGLDSVWDLRKKSLVARLEMPHMGNTVVGFTKDERLVIGSGFIGESLERQLIAWSAVTGRIVWHRAQPDDWEVTDRVGWYLAENEPFLMLVDTTSGHLFRIGMVTDPTDGPNPLVFDDECWAGPERLPSPDGLAVSMPIRKCPELWMTFGEVVRAQSRPEP
jgi:hypothetical protein